LRGGTNLWSLGKRIGPQSVISYRKKKGGERKRGGNTLKKKMEQKIDLVGEAKTIEKNSKLRAKPVRGEINEMIEALV